MGEWNNKKYPHGCRNCGQSEKKHVGLGLCQNCYRDSLVNEAARNGSLVEFDFSDIPVVDNTEDVVVEESVVERRPGSFTSPVSETGDASPSSPPEKKKWWQKKEEQRPTADAPKTSERPPKGAGRRTSTAETISDAWQGLGGVAMRTGHAPLGRYLQWQSPAAGELLDQAISGTFIDKKLLQPAVRARGRFDVVAAVVGPPAIILAIEANPNRAPVLLPVLKQSIRSSLPTILPAMKKAAAREEKVNASVREMFPDIPEGVDPVDLVIDQLFGGYFSNLPNEQVMNEEPQNAEQST